MTGDQQMQQQITMTLYLRALDVASPEELADPEFVAGAWERAKQQALASPLEESL